MPNLSINIANESTSRNRNVGPAESVDTNVDIVMESTTNDISEGAGPQEANTDPASHNNGTNRFVLSTYTIYTNKMEKIFKESPQSQSILYAQ